MKLLRFLTAFLFAIGVFWSSVALAGSIGVLDTGGSEYRQFDTLKMGEDLDKSGDFNTGTISVKDIERQITFTPFEFSLDAGEITSSTTPGLISTHNMTAIEWADGETDAVRVTFRVPVDYKSGGAFRFFMGRGGGDLQPAVDFDVYINADATAFDAAVTDQTPIKISFNIAGGSGDLVEVAITTDFASLAAGQFVTLSIWRDNVNTSTEVLELFWAQFYYTARQ